MVNIILRNKADNINKKKCDTQFFNEMALQKYILLCCQGSRGGLKDKPGKPTDCYHTCYATSGLSLGQNNPNKYGTPIYGGDENRLRLTNPIYNIQIDLLDKAINYFKLLPKCGNSTTSTAASTATTTATATKIDKRPLKNPSVKTAKRAAITKPIVTMTPTAPKPEQLEICNF